MSLLKYLFTNNQDKRHKLEDGTYNVLTNEDKIDECFENERNIWINVQSVLDFNERECSCFDYCDCFDCDSEDYLANNNATCTCYCSCDWVHLYPIDIPDPIKLYIEQKKEIITLLANKGFKLRFFEINLERDGLVNYKPKTDFDIFLAECFSLSQEDINKLAEDRETFSMGTMATNLNILRALSGFAGLTYSS